MMIDRMMTVGLRNLK